MRMCSLTWRQAICLYERERVDLRTITLHLWKVAILDTMSSYPHSVQAKSKANAPSLPTFEKEQVCIFDL